MRKYDKFWKYDNWKYLKDKKGLSNSICIKLLSRAKNEAQGFNLTWNKMWIAKNTLNVIKNG